MSACSTFTPDPFRPTRCCECFLNKSDHSNDSILSSTQSDPSPIQNDRPPAPRRTVLLQRVGSNPIPPPSVGPNLTPLRPAVSNPRPSPPVVPNRPSPLRPVVANSTPPPSVVPNSTSPPPVVPNRTQPVRPIVPNQLPPPSVAPNSTSPRPVVPNSRPSPPVVPNRTPPVRPVVPNSTQPPSVVANSTPPPSVIQNPTLPARPVVPNSTQLPSVVANSTPPPSVIQNPTLPARPVVPNPRPTPPVIQNQPLPRLVIPNPRPSLSAVPNRTTPASTIQNQPPPQPAPLESEKHATRRVLFIGPSGAGKSTIINVLMNNKVEVEYMSSPAGAGDTSTGQTAFFTTYYDLPDNAYTDSIGLGDPRFKAENVMDSLKSVLKMASTGYNKIYICLSYGRITTDIRRYIDLITTTFGKSVLQWSSIIFSRCNDQAMTKENFLRKNKEDTEIVEIVKQVNTVIFGDNMTDEDPEMERVLHKRRKDFLGRIKHDLNNTASKDYFRLRNRNLITRAQNIVKILFGSLPKFINIVNDIKSFAQAVAATRQVSHYHNYFGECSICLGDVTDENRPIITQCSHVYHEKCLMDWIQSPNNQCAMCRTQFDISTNFYITLTADA